MLHKITKILFTISIIAFLTPFLMGLFGFGGEDFAQAGWVYSMLAAPFILGTGLLVVASKK